jgi:2'-5' RNA ligase
MRYVIALVALIPSIFTREAQEQFATASEGYLLGTKSLPHITLAQFYLEDQEALLNIWHEVRCKIAHPHQPKFLGLSLTRKAQGLWGVSLLVARDPALVKDHLVAVEILKQYGIRCISEVGELYRPHLTLARIKEPKINGFNDEIFQPTPFTLALGEADENGQYLTTIFSTGDHRLYKEEL